MALPECTAEGLGAAINCLKCVDGDKLVAFDVVSLALLNGQEVDAATLRNNAACLICSSDEDLRRMETAIMCAAAVDGGGRADCDVDNLMADAKCLACLSKHELLAIRVQLLCEYLTP